MKMIIEVENSTADLNGTLSVFRKKFNYLLGFMGPEYISKIKVAFKLQIQP